MSIAVSEHLPVVYLAGSGHTGSTLLALFLDAHPRIASVGETAFKRKLQGTAGAKLTCTCGASYSECPFWQEIFRGVTDAGYELSPLQWSNDFRYKGWFAHRLLSRYSANPALRLVQRAAEAVLPAHHARQDHVRRVNVELIRTVLRVARADVFFDTSKRAMRLHQLLQAPELHVKVVKLVRDVRGYAWSAKRRGGEVPDAALTWRKDQENFEHITRNMPEDRVMLLRYEDVCRDPQTWLRRTYAFCGVTPIDPPDFVISREHHVLGNSMRRSDTIRIRLDESWRTSLSTDEQEQALAIAGPFHARHGYAAQP
jgi:sulfotransferase family protein